MSTPFLSEIRIMSFNFPPKGWALCNGQLLPINQNQALFALLGTVYGGDGQTTFALPNLQGRGPLHMGAGFTLGQSAGATAVTINIQTLPTHNHFMMARAAEADTSATTIQPGSTVAIAEPYAVQSGNVHAPITIYGSGAPTATMATQAIANVGGSQPHNNMQPYLTLNYCIALQGIFPSQN